MKVRYDSLVLCYQLTISATVDQRRTQRLGNSQRLKVRPELGFQNIFLNIQLILRCLQFHAPIQRSIPNFDIPPVFGEFAFVLRVFSGPRQGGEGGRCPNPNPGPNTQRAFQCASEREREGEQEGDFKPKPSDHATNPNISLCLRKQPRPITTSAKI